MIKIETPLILRADQITLGEFVNQAIGDFSIHVYDLWWDQIEGNNKNEGTAYSLGFYKTFYREKAKQRFEINPKNINFEMTITDLLKKLQEHDAVLDLKHKGMQSNPPEVMIKSNKDIKNYEKLFGAGEFPFLVIHAFRLGNTEYFCYTITR